MKKTFLSAGGSLVGLCLLTLAWLSVRPPMPAGWRSIAPGMQRAAVLAAHPGLFTEMYEVKGFDTLTVPNALPWYPSGYWQLCLTYTADGLVKNVSYHYVNKNCGWFNVTRSRE